MSLRKACHKRREEGFALVEVMIAIVILAIGLLGLAALLAQLSGSTTQSRYLGAEVMFASEKLEDLNQLDYSAYKDSSLAAGGHLNSSDAGYSDTVQISSRSGMISDLDATGVANDMITFQRRWVVEPGVPNAGVERITVLITPTTGSAVEKGETYQASSIRPCDALKGC